MNKILPILILIFSLTTGLEGQPVPCGNPAVMTSYCKDACIICNIDGFTGVNSYTVQGQAPPGFCTSYVHNIKWIAFQAGSVDLQLEVSVFNCQKGSGLEIGIYKSLDCNTFELVSNCETDIPTNTKAIFTNTKPLTIGQYYYFVMDGGNGDVCNYLVKVLKGTTQVTPLDDSGSIIGEPLVCPNVPNTYKKTYVEGAINFDWTLDGLPYAAADSINVVFTTEGSHEICVTASNVCDKAAPSCMTVEVKGIDTTFINQTLCEGECLTAANTQICKAGKYVFDLISEKGCDSTIVVNLTINPVYTQNVSINICEGDTIHIFDQSYYQTGTYTKTGSTWQGCDSTINLDLKLIVCNIKGDAQAKNVLCSGESNGSIDVTILNGTPPFTYKYSLVNSPAILGTGSISSTNLPVTINNFSAGNYIITVQDNYGNSLVLLQNVTEPSLIQFTSTSSDFNKFNISCAGNSDGALAVYPNGGTPPYQYSWSSTQTSNILQDLTAGAYTVTITDSAGCTKSANFNLSEPQALVISEVDYINPDCSGVKTGYTEIKKVNGGVAPYLFDLNGKGFDAITKFINLGNGNYSWTVKDANGCETKITGTLVAPEIPVIGLGEDVTIDLGESELLQTFLNIVPDTVIWSGPTGLSCYNCLEPIATPYNTSSYILTVGSKDNCFTSDSIKITVLPNLKLYIPNAFSPNGDGVNDRFGVFAGIGVKSIRLLSVYSRWGSLLFEQRDSAPNSSGNGWDGTVNGKSVDPGVYVWYAEVEFLDGQKQTYKGDVNLLR